MIEKLLPCVLLLPLVGFVVNGIFGKKIGSERIVGLLGTGTVAVAFVLSLVMFTELLGMPAGDRRVELTLMPWISAGTFSVNFAYLVDPLSMIFLLVITGVGSLIHVYSMGYMHGDRGFARFFSYLNLFIFMMLNLVLGNNFLVTFLGWEGVGFCSFLLIGFWYDKPFQGVGIKWTGDAANKAFIVNRIGDLGMLVGMFILFQQYGSLNYIDVQQSVAASGIVPGGSTMLTTATLCLFLGACGKSAQLPLSVWLPDAMAGPTPVSALIHAATMVTAGVFLVTRNSLLFALTPTTMAVIAGVAAATALIAATIGLVQNDIKKVLAYSTVSQLGFMFIALGVGAWTAAMFHVITHAFFKACLFLGSGSVIHGMHDEQDMQKMGGLKKYMPSTYKTYVIASLAIAGIFPFSGFFSKDEILLHAWTDGNALLWSVAAVAAFCTAFYMFRSVYLTFGGTERFDHHNVHPHETPLMTVPLWILAILAAVGGLIGLPMFLGEHANLLHTWLEPVFRPAVTLVRSHHVSIPMEISLMVVSLAIGVAGILLARHIYLNRPDIADRLANNFKGIHKLLWNNWYIDNIYETAVVRFTTWTSRVVLLQGVDKGIIDGAINGSGRFTAALSEAARRLQNGVAQNYAMLFIAGVAAILMLILFR